MAITLGTFTQLDDGVLTGTFKTLNVTATLTIVPIEKTSDKAPDHRVYAAQAGRTRSLSRNPQSGASWQTAPIVIRAKAGIHRSVTPNCSRNTIPQRISSEARSASANSAATPCQTRSGARS
jgi:Protein of unknown function (DUF736)